MLDILPLILFATFLITTFPVIKENCNIKEARVGYWTSLITSAIATAMILAVNNWCLDYKLMQKSFYYIVAYCCVIFTYFSLLIRLDKKNIQKIILNAMPVFLLLSFIAYSVLQVM